MPRGRTPRQPARTGRQEGVRVGTGTTARPRSAAPAAAPKSRRKTDKTAPAYNPLAPDRIAEILKRLDQLYPEVTCALTHSSAWELLVATILSAQSTDANVNRVTPELYRK
jgi:endonuclease-3